MPDVAREIGNRHLQWYDKAWKDNYILITTNTSDPKQWANGEETIERYTENMRISGKKWCKE